MTRFLLKSIVSMCVTMLLVSVSLFWLLEAGSGDVTRKILGPFATPAQRASYRSQLGLDQSVWMRYTTWLLGNDWWVEGRLGIRLVQIPNRETGEREWSVASAGSKGRRGFATLEIDTTDAEPEDRWKVEVHYYDERDFAANPYESRLYTLRDRQFKA